ncbi:rhodanese-like domain-containing protein [Methylophilaceae bacterium]|nr:rhodanese-like domain-containing protein [Methylophilaceae bacterium]
MFFLEKKLDFFVNNIALFFLIAVSGLLLILPNRSKKIISVKESVVLINRQPTILVDVRNANEFTLGRIDNALNIPLDQLAENIDKLKKNPNKTILVYCQKGFRSSQAVKILNKLGIDSAVGIEGGLDAWQKDNLPIKTDS